MQMSSRRHTATDMLEPKHNCMICTSFGMWSIGPMGNNLNHTLKDLPLPPPPQSAAGDNTSSSTSFACGLLALPSLTHTLKDLPLPLWAIGNDASQSTPFACGLLAFWAVTLPTHSRIYLRHAKWEALMWLVVTKTGNHTSQRHHHKDRAITHHKEWVITSNIAQWQTHIKSS